jgi:hypothetical protein
MEAEAFGIATAPNVLTRFEGRAQGTIKRWVMFYSDGVRKSDRSSRKVRYLEYRLVSSNEA